MEGQVKNDIIEKVAEAPAVALEKAIEVSKEIGETLENNQPVRKAEKYWNNLGPGLTTGASDDDPSGIAMYSQTGTRFGFQFLWLAGFTFPLMAVVQEMCARIGLVTGKGLAANIRQHFPKPVLFTATILLFLANSFNIGANIGAMAESTRLLAPNLNFALLAIFFTVISLGLQIFVSYKTYAKLLKWLALVLFAYVATAFMVAIDWSQVLRSALIPTMVFNKEQIVLVCGILGTTISPYLFFWQTSQEVEEDVLLGRVTVKLRQAFASGEEMKKMRIDVWSGMFLSNLVMFFIITVCAAVLNSNGIMNIETAADAASALKPFAGESAYLLFAVGIIGTGLLAIPVLAGSASYALSESFGWKYGLYRKLKEAYAFYGIIIIATLVGLSFNFIGLDPIKALIYSAIANGLVAPVVLVLILLLSSNKKIMGKWANGWVTKSLGWLITILMAAAGIATIYSFF
jgi:NRAMP (natural resistance-associated macrophage protein)-like metal ion transporter